MRELLVGLPPDSKPPVCVFQGTVAPRGASPNGAWLGGLLGSSPRAPDTGAEAVVRLSTREVCWKHFSLRRFGGKAVTYQVDSWRLETSPFEVVGAETASSVLVPRLRSFETEAALEKIDLALVRAERLPLCSSSPDGPPQPLPSRWWSKATNALVRGRYASHVEEKEKVLRTGTKVTVVGRVAEHNKTQVAMVPDKNTCVFITERTPEEILSDLDARVSSSLVAIGGLALASVFFASVLGVYAFVVTRALYRAVVQKKKKKGALERALCASSEEEEEEEEGNEEGDVGYCCICLSRKSRYVLVPCGHCCACKVCAISLFSEAENKGSEPRCPICRTEIDNFVRMYK